MTRISLQESLSTQTRTAMGGNPVKEVVVGIPQRARITTALLMVGVIYYSSKLTPKRCVTLPAREKKQAPIMPLPDN